MGPFTAFAWSPRLVGLVCAVGSVGLGLAYLAVAGAPTRYVVVNASALVVGLLIVTARSGWNRQSSDAWGPAALTIGLILLVTALFGPELEGIKRWVQLGPLSLQPSLILVPILVLKFSRSRSALATGGVVLSAAALALQPDRAMAGALAAALAILALTKPDRWGLISLTAGLVGFAVTLARADPLQAQPFVEQVLYSAFEVAWWAGWVVWIGVVLLIVPAITGLIRDRDNRQVYAVFGAFWLGVVMASLLGKYPTPLVGYGTSSILGYALALTMLPGTAFGAQKAAD